MVQSGNTGMRAAESGIAGAFEADRLCYDRSHY